MFQIKKYLPKPLLVMFCLMFLFVAKTSIGQDAPCGEKLNPCEITTGSYNTAFPENWTGGPAVFHLHGYGGTGSKVIGNTGFTNNFTKRGYAVIAPTGQRLFEDRPNSHDWAVDDGTSYPRDDIKFLTAVIDDVITRFNIDRDRILITGFSRGGSMAWELACFAPDTARAYAPASGGFWAPFPSKCAGPVKLLHTHGFVDKTVPLEGRHAVWDGVEYTQSDIYQGMQLWRQTNGCGSRAKKHIIDKKIWRKIWGDCTESAALELALHSGGHGLPKGWSTMVLDWFEDVVKKP